MKAKSKLKDNRVYIFHFRAILSTCILAIDRQNLDKSNKTYSEYKLLLHNLELIWHLCEVLFLVTVPGNKFNLNLKINIFILSY